LIFLKVDELIQKIDQIIEQTQRLKKSMLYRLFTRGIQHTNFKNTTIGKLPQDWMVVTLKDIIQSYKNGIYKQPKYHGKGIPNIRMFNIKDGKINTIGAPLIDVTEQEALDYELKIGDILINRVNSSDLVGKAGIVKEDLGRVVFDSMNIRARVWTEKCDPMFLSYFFNTRAYYQQIRSAIKLAVAQSSINQQDLDNVQLGLPPIFEQRAIISTLSKIEEKAELYNREGNMTEILRRGLMRKLLTGQIRVKV